MRILVLNADYPRFLTWLYRRQTGLENTPYATQMAARNASLFGVADFYSRNFGASDHEKTLGFTRFLRGLPTNLAVDCHSVVASLKPSSRVPSFQAYPQTPGL